MSAFTGDLENDLELLAEEHDITAVQVATAAVAQLPGEVRRSLLTDLMAVMPQPIGEVPHPAEAVEPYSQTGLPQKLRGAIHALGRNYPRNLVVDAAMLEMPPEQREAVARCFLPRPPKPEPSYTFVAESTRGPVLGKAHEAPPEILVIEGGRSVHYNLIKVLPQYDFREDENDPQVRNLAIYRKAGGQ